MENLDHPFTGRDITPLDTCHKNLIIRSIVIVEILFSEVNPFLALLLTFGHFDHFLPSSTKCLQHFLGSKK